MTLKEFFRRARRGRRWHVNLLTGEVRCETGFCPLGAVAQMDDWADNKQLLPDAYQAAKKIGVPVRVAHKIANAADWSQSDDRKWLLKNLGVKP